MIVQIEDKSYHLLKDEDKELINQIINDPTRSLNAGGVVQKPYFKNIPDVDYDDIVMSHVAKCEKNFGFEKGGLVTKTNNDKMSAVPRSKELTELILKLGQSAIEKLKLKDKK